MSSLRLPAAASLFARGALAFGYLSAVADRFGLWGPPGTPGVAWGAWTPFVAYTAKLNPYASAPVVQALAGLATFAEVALAAALLCGWRVRLVSLASALLASLFAVAMTATLGPKAPLDYSVWSVVAASLLLAAIHSATAPDRSSAAPPSTTARQPRCSPQPTGVSIQQLHTPILDAAPPPWRCLIRPALVLLAVIFGIWTADSL